MRYLSLTIFFLEYFLCKIEFLTDIFKSASKYPSLDRFLSLILFIAENLTFYIIL